MNRVNRLKFVLWTVVGLAVSAAAARFIYGLGATTNLSDGTPWGLWIGFDVMGGVALAAGGFIMTAAVYIFRLERLHDVVRPAVLTAFLGYISVAVGLLFDLGLPWNIWHMIVFWNPHSPLFEVGWCVMLYLTVLTLEFLPVPAEEFSALARIRRFLLGIRLPLVILGIGLSTLHQSSLGSLFLIMPYRLHPLWYSPILPVLFLVSAVGLGMMMVMFESHSTAYLYHRKPETEALASLAGGARWVLLLYAITRLADLAASGRYRHLLSGWHAVLFWFEICAMALVPAVLLCMPAVRRARGGQWAAASLGVFGVVLNRIDTGGLAHVGMHGQAYFPAWTEVAVSAGVVSAAVLAFLFLVERFRVWEQRPADWRAAPHALPEFDPVGVTWLGVPAVAGRTVYSLGFIIAASIGFAVLTPRSASSRGVLVQPVQRARGGTTLWIDGNLDGFGVAFPHARIQARLGGDASCVKCHHMNLPRDRNSGCYECHGQMYLASDAFRHDWHASPTGGRLACGQCHDPAQPRSAGTAKRCIACHKDLVPAGAVIPVKQYRTPGYVQAMHRGCIGCHTQLAKQDGKPDFARCATCHGERRGLTDANVASAPRGMLLPVISR